MDATATADTTQRPTTSYRSPKHALVWFFRKSRNNWKAKYQKLRAFLKKLQNRARDASKSREHWKARAHEAEAERDRVQAENEQLRERLAATAAEKKGSRMCPRS